MIAKVKSVLEQLEDVVAVDADTFDTDFIKSMPFKPNDATSNQGFIHAALVDPRNKEIVDRTVAELKGESWEAVYAVCVARFAKNVLPLITGRVFAQTSTRFAYDVDRTVEHAHRYAKAFEAEGITSDRFCIKIPVTSSGVRSAQILKSEGIPTLGTALFSVHQALAASQAGMIAISMYLNDPRAHSDVKYWPDVADAAVQAPMSPRHRQIREAFDRLAASTGEVQPQMKTASFCVPGDALACVELGADALTIGIPVLTDLMEYSSVPQYRPGMWHVSFKEQAEDKEDADREWQLWTPGKPSDARMLALLKSDPVSAVAANKWKVASTEVDYMAPGVVDRLNEDDPATRDRLAAALNMFTAFELESQSFLQGLQS